MATAETRTAPPEVKRWNWGGFLLGWIWAVVHRLWWQAVVAFLLGIIMQVVLGIKGSEWAWEKGNYSSVEEFQKSQRAWTIAGAALWGIGLLIVVVAIAAG